MCKRNKKINHKLYLKMKEESISKGYILIFILGILAVIDKSLSEMAIETGYVMASVIITAFILCIAGYVQNIIGLGNYSKENDLSDEERETVLDLKWDSKKMIGLTLVAATMTYVYYI